MFGRSSRETTPTKSLGNKGFLKASPDQHISKGRLSLRTHLPFLLEQSPLSPSSIRNSARKLSKLSIGSGITQLRGLRVVEPKKSSPKRADKSSLTEATQQAAEEIVDDVVEECVSPPPNDEISAFNAEPEDSELDETPSTMIHEGHKLFWRINRTIDFRVFMSDDENAVVVRSFDPAQNREFAPIILDLTVVKAEVAKLDSAMAAHQHSLTAMTAEKKKWQSWQQEGELEANLKQRQHQADARRRQSLTKLTPDQFKAVKAKQEAEELAQRRALQRKEAGKVAAFVITRFEAEKDKATGIIYTKVVPRPADPFTSEGLLLSPDAVPKRVRAIGRSDGWNKQENSHSIRQTSVELVNATEATSAACKIANEKRKSVQAALDVVRALSNRKHFESLPPHKQRFQAVVKKALFQQRLERVQDTFDQSATYTAFEAKLAKP